MFRSGSFKLFEVGGTAVRIHPTFFLLLAWIGAAHWLEGGPGAAASGVLFVLVLFVCVVLHEFGHILMARRFGVRTPDVTLLPIGGVAAMERIPEKPVQEILVALAGPAVNLVIFVVLLAVLGARFDVAHLVRPEVAEPGFLAQVAEANLALLVFNLIPAFPMDGGRVLRALLSLGMGRARATRVAATLGQGIAILLGVLGLLGNPMLILVALFIFLAASGEAGYVEMQDQTRGASAREAMISTYKALAPDADLDRAAALLLETTQQEFPVVDGSGGLRGVLTRASLIAALRERGGKAPVLEVMTTGVPTLPETAPLGQAIELLQGKAAPVIGILDAGGRLTGFVNLENLTEFLWLKSARERSPARS